MSYIVLLFNNRSTYFLKTYFKIITISVLFWTQTEAQQLHNPFVLNEELPSEFINDITRDSTGFVWIATNEGLSRYDGFNISSYFPREFGVSTHNNVQQILYDDEQNRLWAATGSQIIFMDLESKRIKVVYESPPRKNGIKSNVSCLVQVSPNDIWFGIEGIGIGHVIINSEQVTTYEIDISITAPMVKNDLFRVLTLEKDKKNPKILWIGTVGGLLQFNTDERDYKSYYFLHEDLETQIYLNQIRAITSLPDQSLLMGSWSSSLIRFRPSPAKGNVHLLNPSQYQILDGYKSSPPLLLLSDTFVLHNSISTCRLNINSGVQDQCISMYNELGIQYLIEVKMIDEWNRKWAASEYGVHIFDSLAQQVEQFQFPVSQPTINYHIDGSVFELESGDLLLCYSGSEGIQQFNRNSKQFTLISPSTNEFLSQNGFMGRGVLRRPNGEIWVLDKYRVYRLDQEDKIIIPIELPIDKLGKFWKTFIQDKDGGIWLGAQSMDLVYYHAETGEMKKIPAEIISPVLKGPSSIKYLLEDKQHNIWMSLETGYTVYNKIEADVIHIDSFNNQIFECNNFVEDGSGSVWSAIYGLGLIRMDPKNPADGIVELIGKDDGIEETRIKTFIQGRDGLFWMITASGLQSYDPINRVAKVFTEKDGIRLQDPRFNRNPLLSTVLIQLSDGKIAYVPRAGLSIFEPGEMRSNTEIPKPYIRRISMGDSILAEDVFFPDKEYTFPYRNSNISIECSALGFSQTEYARFQYKVDDSEWREIDNRRLQLNNVAPGSYNYAFKVINADGLSSIPLTWAVEIQRPWWRTLWFYILSGLFIIAIAWISLKARDRRKERIQNKQREMEILIASLESQALRNQMNPHFLFNIFNNIQELILTGDTQRAYTYTTKFSKLLRTILEYSDKDEITINQEVAFLKLYLELESLRFDEVFSYKINVEEGIDFLHLPAFMVQPLVENSIRHGLLPKEGEKHVGINFSINNDMLLCIVSDNGNGLQSDPEVQNSDDRNHALQLIRDRLKLIDSASITVKNNQKGGVTSMLKIPLHQRKLPSYVKNVSFKKL